MAKQRVEPETRRARRARRQRAWIVGAALAVVAVALGGYFAYRAAATLPGSPVPSQGNQHIQSESTPHVEYSTDPPTS